MFYTSTGIKRSFYNQTGNFQFESELVIDSLLGGLNVGISGSSNNIPIKINYFCNSGKIWDNNSRFVGVYSPGVSFIISGNITSNYYDYFIDNNPVSYSNPKNTGFYNNFYINPININCGYNIYINGETPNLSISDINCFTGQSSGTGYIVNNGLPVTIYSGSFTNLPDNMPFSFSDIFTGLLNNGGSGAFYIYPNENSVGLYTGNLQLVTNGGILNYNSNINITGDPLISVYDFNLNGVNTISVNTSQLYISNVECSSGSGIGIVFSLSYFSGIGSSGSGFTGCWDLFTGLPYNYTDYRSGGFYNIEKTSYFNNYPSFYSDSTAYAKIYYNSGIAGTCDVAILNISGWSFPSGLNMKITGLNY